MRLKTLIDRLYLRSWNFFLCIEYFFSVKFFHLSYNRLLQCIYKLKTCLNVIFLKILYKLQCLIILFIRVTKMQCRSFLVTFFFRLLYVSCCIEYSIFYRFYEFFSLCNQLMPISELLQGKASVLTSLLKMLLVAN